MLSKLCYYATTFLEAGLSVFGLRGMYEQPSYDVRQVLGPHLEIRDYGPRVAVETTVEGSNRSAAASIAFGRLFDYITGANSVGRTVAMTVPVQQTTESRMIAMTTPVQTTGGDGSVTMRFFLPQRMVREGIPAPKNPNVHITTLPPVMLAALSFSGPLSEQASEEQGHLLLQRLSGSAWQPKGQPFVLGYDPPFTIPFLRRNEVAVEVRPR